MFFLPCCRLLLCVLYAFSINVLYATFIHDETIQISDTVGTLRMGLKSIQIPMDDVTVPRVREAFKVGVRLQSENIRFSFQVMCAVCCVLCCVLCAVLCAAKDTQ